MEEEITIWKKGDIIYGVGVSGLIKIYKVKKVIPFVIPGYVILKLEGLFINDTDEILIEDTKVDGSTYKNCYYASTVEKAYVVWNTVLKNTTYSYASV